MFERSKPEFKPIEKGETREGRKFFCVGCGNSATQTAQFKVEGAIILERYCDACANNVEFE